MNKRKLFLILPLLPGLLLASCGETTSQSTTYVSPFNTSRLSSRFNYIQDAGADGVTASMEIEHPELVSADDTFSFVSYIWGTTNFKGYYDASSGLVTMEDSIRDDVTTSYGKGYPIVSLGDECFASASKAAIAAIKGINLGKNITSIGTSCFSGLTALETLNLSELTKLEYIGDGAFDNVPWYTSQVSGNTNSLLTCGNVVIDYSGTSSSVTIPEGVTAIYQDAFKGHGELTSVSLPSTLKTIGKDAFNGTGLTSVNTPNSVTSISSGAFAGCTSMVSANLASAELGEGVLTGNTNLASLTYFGGEAISSLCGEAGLEKLTNVKITGEEIVKDGLAGLTNLTSVDLSNSVKVIQTGAFTSDDKLTTLSNTDSVEFVYDNSLSDSAWYANQADGAIYIGTNLLEVKAIDKASSQIKSNITGISKEGFKGFTDSLTLPSTVKYLGEKALYGCKKLTTVDLPKAVLVGKSSLAYCTGLTSVKLAENCTISENFLANDEAITSLALPFASADDGLEYILGDADLSYTLESYTFLASADAKAVPDKMFYKYKALTSVTFSSTIKSIGVKAFAYCTGLTKIDFPINVQTIDVLAFAECSSLTKVNFNVSATKNADGSLAFDGVKSIKTLAFLNCSKLGESTINGCAATEGMFMMPESVRLINGNILQGTIVQTIQMRVIDYYLAGVITQTDIATDQEYIQMSKQWNDSPDRGTDKYGNANKIPYTILIIDSADY